MAANLSERQQRAAERILEDESLTEDLTDAPARALISWASEQASALAADEGRSDKELSDALKAVRSAVRAAATSGETDGAALVAKAQAALAASLGRTGEKTSATTSPAAQEASEPSAKAASQRAKPVNQPHGEKDAEQTHETQPAHREEHQYKPHHERAEKHIKAAPPSSLRVPDPPARASTRVAKSKEAEQTPNEEEGYERWLEDVANDEQE